MCPFIHALPEVLLFFHRQMDRLQACRATTPLISPGTFRTLDKQQMATLILTIGMGIGRFSALMAVGDDLSADAFAQPVVKNKVLTPEFILQSLLFHHIRIM